MNPTPIASITTSNYCSNMLISFQDQEIHDLKSKMDEMAEEFGEMLRVSAIFFHIVLELVALKYFTSLCALC